MSFTAWVDTAFERHLSELQWSEIARALTSLSSDYVHRRGRVAQALDGRGKRAAFALYYAPRHHRLVSAVLDAVDPGAAATRPAVVVDLGCGIGVAGAAWSRRWAAPVPVLGIDAQAWAVAEARALTRALGVPFRGLRGNLDGLRWPAARAAIVAAFVINELDVASQARLRARIEARIAAGDALLVVEPLAKRIAPWWPEWARAVRARGGREDEWRFQGDTDERVAALGRSAGLDPRELGCRSLWIAGSA